MMNEKNEHTDERGINRTAIIADDEEPLRSWLKKELSRVWPKLTICGEAENGIQALEMISGKTPDIAFLDIRMPGLTGLQVASRVLTDCRIVFITAFDQFAVEAFEREAVDNLLKPVDPERLLRTAKRLKARLKGSAGEPGNWRDLLHSLEARLSKAASRSFLQWIKATDGRGDLRLLSTDEIIYFQARDKYTAVHSRGGEFLIRKPIKELSEELDPDVFWQIHRSSIVKASSIEKMSISLAGRYQLTLKGISGVFTVSRSFQHRFKSM